MTRKEKIYAILILLFISMNLCCFYKADAQAQEKKETTGTYGFFQYKYIQETDSIRIVGYVGNEEVVVIPSEIDGKPVREIKYLRDYYSREDTNPDTKEIVIPDGVTKIGGMESCKNVVKVYIPDSVVEIERYAFKGCDKMETVNLPDGLKSLGHHAFWECKSLKEITLPKGLSVIGDGTFAYCQSLQKVVIPYGVRFIRDGVFEGCDSLNEVNIPDSVMEMGGYVFSRCKNLSRVKLSKNLTVIKEESFCGCNIKSIELPKKLTGIGRRAFARNPIKQIVIPSKVTYVEDYAFYSCRELKKITMKGKKMEEIEKRAFGNIHPRAVFDVPNKCIPKYKKMLVASKSFKEGKMKIK